MCGAHRETGREMNSVQKQNRQQEFCIVSNRMTRENLRCCWDVVNPALQENKSWSGLATFSAMWKNPKPHQCLKICAAKLKTVLLGQRCCGSHKRTAFRGPLHFQRMDKEDPQMKQGSRHRGITLLTWVRESGDELERFWGRSQSYSMTCLDLKS